MLDNDFNIHGYCILHKVMDTTKLWEYAKSKITEGRLDDEQAPGSPSFYKDIELAKIQLKLLPLMEKATGLKLYPTYTYHRLYKTGAVLLVHKDRPACEISASLCMGYEGVYNWPLWIKDKNNQSHEYVLEPGDMLIYKGCELEHWREKYDKGILHGAAFLHYVDQNGPYENCIYDWVKL